MKSLMFLNTISNRLPNYIDIKFRRGLVQSILPSLEKIEVNWQLDRHVPGRN